MVARHFLACCSEDAKGDETTVEVQVEQEFFTAKGLAIRELNYLEVYIYEKWAETSVPNFEVGM